MQDYHRIRAWKKAHALAIDIHRLAKNFPRGYGSLRSQIMRSAESVPFNIVEGCGAATPKEFARFLDISIKSLSEIEGQLELGNDYGIITDLDCHTRAEDVRVIRKMTWSLRERVLGNDPSTSIGDTTTENRQQKRKQKTENGKRKTDNGKRRTENGKRNARP
jgi:four helix bundle protein